MSKIATDGSIVLSVLADLSSSVIFLFGENIPNILLRQQFE